jgi:hypothetical protein
MHHSLQTNTFEHAFMVYRSFQKKLIKRDKRVCHQRVRMTECHDWSYTEMLWKKNDHLITLTVALNIALYMSLAYFTVYEDGYRGIDNMYLITATLTTVRVYMIIIIHRFSFCRDVTVHTEHVNI